MKEEFEVVNDRLCPPDILVGDKLIVDYDNETVYKDGEDCFIDYSYVIDSADFSKKGANINDFSELSKPIVPTAGTPVVPDAPAVAPTTPNILFIISDGVTTEIEKDLTTAKQRAKIIAKNGKQVLIGQVIHTLQSKTTYTWS